MRIEPKAVSRRSLLATSASLAVAGPAVVRASTAPRLDPHRVTFLSDTHVPGKIGKRHLGCVPLDCMRHIVDAVDDHDAPPSAVVINGDCAFMSGKAEDYATFGRALQPLHRRSIPVHLAVGNHDDRKHFTDVLGRVKPNAKALDPRGLARGRMVDIIETERANFFVLDSLDPSMRTRGRIGTHQMLWLAYALDARRDKPAVVVCHHDLETGGLFPSGLKDAGTLLKVLARRRHVKAYLFGHTHRWKIEQFAGIHLVNLPSTSWRFNTEQPTGWVDAELLNDGMKLKLHTLDPRHRKNGNTHLLKWRA